MDNRIPYSKKDYEKKRIRELDSGREVKSEVEIFIEIIKASGKSIKREEILLEYSNTERCAISTAEIVFNKFRKEILKSGKIMQPERGFYKYIEDEEEPPKEEAINTIHEIDGVEIPGNKRR